MNLDLFIKYVPDKYKLLYPSSFIDVTISPVWFLIFIEFGFNLSPESVIFKLKEIKLFDKFKFAFDVSNPSKPNILYALL